MVQLPDRCGIVLFNMTKLELENCIFNQNTIDTIFRFV